MPRILSSLLVMFIWLAAGHHCFIEQMMAGSEFPQTPVKECDSHKPADSGSHNEGEYCRGASLASLAEFKKLESAAELSSFFPVLALIVTSSFADSSQLPRSTVTPNEATVIHNLVSSLSTAPNAPPVLLS